MAAALVLRSLARKMACAPPAHHHPLLARGLHGSGPGSSSLTQPPTMAAAGGLRSLATKVARAPPHHRLVHAQRGLHSLNSTPPTSKLDFAKIRFGVAYVALFGSLAYLYGWLLPRLKRLEAIVEAQKQPELDDALAIDASIDGPDTAQIMQSSGRGKQTENKTMYEDLEAKISRIERKLEAARKDKHD